MLPPYPYLPPPPPALISLNTVDFTKIDANWAATRVTNLPVDGGGVTFQLKTGERILSVVVSPKHAIKIFPLDGVLCEQKCSGTAPTAINIYAVPPVVFRGVRRLPGGASFVIITTNSGNIYKIKAYPGTPTKRTFVVGT